VAQSFQGFGPKALPFLKALGFHQSREWFAENRPLYESEIKQPMHAMIAGASLLFAEHGIPLKGDGAAAMFRVNRDARFSKDKSPYNTHASAVLTRNGTKKDAGGAYIHVKPGECFVGAGIWFIEPPVLNALRRKITAFPDTFLAIEDALLASGLPLATDDELKRVPPGFQHVTEPRLARLMRQKHFFANKTVADDAITAPGFLDTLVEVTTAMMPLFEFCWPVLDEPRVQSA
jgi:uncharacterized protein (TIGR02453 family)